MIPYGDYPDLSTVRRILVVKLRHHGDVLLTAAVFTALKQALPQAEVDAYVYRETLPMLDGHPAITGFRLAAMEWKRLRPWARIAAEWRLLREIRARRYDLVLNLTEGDRGTLTAWLAGARIRVGWTPEGGLWFKRRLLTHIVKRPRLPRHMVEQNLDALRRIGIFPPPGRALALHIPASAREHVRGELAAAGIAAGAYVLIHPTSRWMFKCWPLARVIELIRALHADGHRVVLSGAPDAREQAMIAEVMRQCADVPLLNLAGRLDLKQLAALIDDCALLVAVDSVPAHIASALQRPTVVLFGPSSEQAWGPWQNPRARVLAQAYPCRPCNLDGCGGSKVADCLDTLPLAPVLAAARELLAPARA